MLTDADLLLRQQPAARTGRLSVTGRAGLKVGRLPTFIGSAPWKFGAVLRYAVLPPTLATESEEGADAELPPEVECDVCALDWTLHTPDAKGKVTLDECVRLLRAELAKPRPQFYATTSYGNSISVM